MVDVAVAIDRLHSDPRALPRLATLIENEDSRALDLLEAIYPQSGQAHIVGITGPPGVGKSALIDALVTAIRETERRVAVIAVDPSSPYTGGAVLGDRIRMMRHHSDAGVFLRSMASRGRTGGLAWSTAELTHLLDVAGFPIVLVETVGTGQDGTDVAALADTVVVLDAPGLGDSVQAMKSGLLETGDILVVNKADRPGASETLRSLRAAISLAPVAGDRLTPVLKTSAANGEGVGDLLAAIDAHYRWLTETGLAPQRRARAARAEVFAALRETFNQRLNSARNESPVLGALVARVAGREITARRAAQEIAAALDLDSIPSAGRTVGDERGC